MNLKEARTIVKTMEYIENGKPPYDGNYTNEDNCFRWYRVTSNEEWEALKKVFDGESYGSMTYPDWVCVENADGWIDFENLKLPKDALTYFTSLRECKNAFDRLLFSLGEQAVFALEQEEYELD